MFVSKKERTRFFAGVKNLTLVDGINKSIYSFIYLLYY